MNVLNEYKVKVSFPIAWGEMDAFNHVNNVVYFRYFENARVKYYENAGLIKLYEEEGFAGIVKSISCEYLIPIVFPDIIEVGARVIEIKDHIIKMEHYISSESKGLCAFGESEIVMVNMKTNKKELLPVHILNKIEEIENIKF